MNISSKGLDIIKLFEGCRLKAYKPVPAEQYYTIGWGHYGPDVTPNMTISQERADQMLIEDVKKFEGYVTKTGLDLNQNQFDALVSFTYNCGQKNLQTLVKNRTLPQIADAMLLYNKGADKKVLAGLEKRRKMERDLFLSNEGIKSYNVITPELIRKVLNNDFGTGAARKAKLTAEGYDYDAVQKRVTQVLQFANDVQNTKKLAGEYWDVVWSQVK